LVNIQRFIKIQNDHPTITIQWNLIIEQQDDWWQIESGSPHNGTLAPGEYININLCVDRSNKADGEYHGKFKVKSTGPGYSYTSEVNFTMVVGGEDPGGHKPDGTSILTFADKNGEVFSKQSITIENNYPSGNLNWNLQIDNLSDWWQIEPGSPESGSLGPGEKTNVFVMINRSNRAVGEYWSHFIVNFSKEQYKSSVLIALNMEVGHPEPRGPSLINIKTNSGNDPNRLVLTFDKYPDPNSTYKAENFIITPPVGIDSITVLWDKVFLKTANHQYRTAYTLNILQIKDLRGRIESNLVAGYQFNHHCAGTDVNITGSAHKYEWDSAWPDKRIYTDRPFTMGQIPEDLMGIAMLRTSQNDGRQNNLAISFTTNCDDIQVLLACDPRQSSAWDNEWLRKSFTKSSFTIPVNGIPEVTYFDLYESNEIFPAAQLVTLQQNGALTENHQMYVVLVRGVRNLSGKINYYATGRGIPNIAMNVPAGLITAQNTTVDSVYGFSALTAYTDFFITPIKSDDIPRTTLLMHDACLAAQIATQMLPNPSDAQLIAADMDSNGKVTMADAGIIANHVVGLNLNPESLVGQWTFLPQIRRYRPLDSNYVDQNFTGIVMGDVDGNWQPINSVNQTRSTIAIKLIQTASYLNHIWLPEIVAASTETTVVIPILVSDDLSGQRIASYTGEINWDESVIRHPRASQVGTLTAEWGDNNYYQNDQMPGKLIFGQFATNSSLADSGVIVNLIFDIAGKPGDSTRIHLNLFALNSNESVLTDNRLRINHPPECEELAISPGMPLESDSLHGSYLYQDVDGDPEKLSKIRWYKNGVMQPQFNNLRTIPAAAIQGGEQWYFVVKPRDSFEYGHSKQSPTVTINNPVRAEMKAFPIFGKPGLTVHFSNQSIDNSAYFRWDFGDGAPVNVLGTEQPPEHTYPTTGYYTVSLRASGNAGVDSVIYPQLICIDNDATELVLVDSGATRPHRSWMKAIDHNVITDEGTVFTALTNAWAKFAFLNEEERKITQVRLKRSSYYSTSEPGRKVNAFEIQTASNSSEFRPLLSAELDSDDWAIYPIKDSSPARYVRLQLLNTEDSSQDSCEFGEFQIFSTPVTVSVAEKPSYSIPNTFRIINNFPNPFNNMTIIAYDIAETARISLSIYNVQGQLVRQLMSETQEPNTYHIIWDGTDDNGQMAVNGVYFCRMRISHQEKEFYLPTQKILLLK
jgi:PKD repeat protein